MTYVGPGQAWASADAVGGNWDVVTMVAIAGAESGWDTTAISYTNDYGLWQINHDVWTGLFNDYTWDNADDNAKMAYYVWQQQGYRAWVTYQTGAYRQYLSQAQDAAGSSGNGGGGGGATESVVQPQDWAGWDYSGRVSSTGLTFLQAFNRMNDYGSVIRSFYGYKV